MDLQLSLAVAAVVVGSALLVAVVAARRSASDRRTDDGDDGGGREHVTDDDCERIRRHLRKSPSRRSPDDLLPGDGGDREERRDGRDR